MHLPNHRYEYLLINPITSVQAPTATGTYMEYKIEPVENQLLCKIIYHLIIFNNDTVNTLYLPSIPLIFDFSSLVKTGRDLV